MARVLIVEDDPDIAELVALKLQLEGHTVTTEEDGDAGLVAVRQDAPDLVLLDWMMPRRTGIEICEAMRADPATARIPVILLTAKTQDADIQRGFAAGADDYVSKPFSPSELASRVRAVLARATR